MANNIGTPDVRINLYEGTQDYSVGCYTPLELEPAKPAVALRMRMERHRATVKATPFVRGPENEKSPLTGVLQPHPAVVQAHRDPGQRTRVHDVTPGETIQLTLISTDRTVRVFHAEVRDDRAQQLEDAYVVFTHELHRDESNAPKWHPVAAG